MNKRETRFFESLLDHTAHPDSLVEDSGDNGMKPETFLDLMHHTLWLMGLLSAPVLLSSLVLGVGIGVVQVVTAIQEQTLSFVPKLILAMLVLALAMPWMLSTMVTYTQQIFVQLQALG